MGGCNKLFFSFSNFIFCLSLKQEEEVAVVAAVEVDQVCNSYVLLHP